MASIVVFPLLFGSLVVMMFVAAREISTVSFQFLYLLTTSWPCRGSVRLTLGTPGDVAVTPLQVMLGWMAVRAFSAMV